MVREKLRYIQTDRQTYRQTYKTISFILYDFLYEYKFQFICPVFQLFNWQMILLAMSKSAKLHICLAKQFLDLKNRIRINPLGLLITTKRKPFNFQISKIKIFDSWAKCVIFSCLNCLRHIKSI